MRAFPRSAQAFIWLVVLAAAVVSVVLSRSLEIPTSLSPRLVLLLLTLASVLADFYHIHLNYKIEITMSTSSNFAATLIFGAPVAALAGVCGSVGGDLALRKTWYKVMFNASSTVLSIAISSYVYRLIDSGGTLPLGSVRNAAAISISGLAYLLVNMFIMCTVIALIEKARAWDVARSNFRGMTFQLVTLIPLGTLVTVVYEQTPWGLLLLVFPILMTYLASENYQRLRRESKNTIELLAEAVDKRDRYTYQHSSRVAYYAEKIAHVIRVDIDTLTTIVFAARVHDLGKIGINSDVLLKRGKLDPGEWEIMRQHPDIGATMMSQLSLYEGIKELIAYHHEWVDGRGYPHGAKGDEIPLGARIIGVADAYEAMTSDRPYRKALPQEVAIAELERGKGTQFDAEIVDCFIGILEEELGKEPRSARIELGLSPSEQQG